MLRLTHKHVISSTAENAIREALKEVPEDATGIIAIAFTLDNPPPPARDVVVDGKIYNLRYDPTFGDKPPNTLCLGYGQGFLE